MSSISRLISKELRNAFNMPSGAIDNPKYNPLFKEGKRDPIKLSEEEEVTLSTLPSAAQESLRKDLQEGVDSTVVAEFYSPLESAIQEAPIGKKGTKGQNIEAFVRKRAPKVSQGELDFRQFGLEPEEKYTKDVISGAFELDPLKIQALKKAPKYRGTQRQTDLEDLDIGYQEIGIDVIQKDLGLMTHHGPSTLAHARYSYRQETPSYKTDAEKLSNVRFDEDADYLLIEELQSDVIQKMVDNPEKAKAESIQKYRKQFESDIDDIAFKEEFSQAGDFFEEFENFVFNKYIPLMTDKKLTKAEGSLELKKIFDKEFPNSDVTGSVRLRLNAVERYFEMLAEKKLNVYDFSGKANILQNIRSGAIDVIAESQMTTSKKDTPLPKLTDSVRVLLQSIIADAKANNVDEIVLPPIEKLAEKRFSKGSKEYESAIKKGSGFYNTYVTAFDKALKQLKDELGDQIKIGKKDLNYKRAELSLKEEALALRFPRGDLARRLKAAAEKPETLQGKSINIKDLKLDPKKQKLRFNQGGLVQRPNT